ncbi:MAG TPA: methylmalonyl-CoA mutase [Firmicutes bacterium]|nr:methylmalonyl-CoA mutase [Bacillota bacterium]
MNETFNDGREKFETEVKNQREAGKIRSPKSTSGFDFNATYSPFDIQGTDVSTDIGWPGEFPYTRGVYPTMFLGKFWTMRQYAGFGDAEDTNRRYHFLIDSGITGLSVAFDLPTQLGLDSDSPLSEGEVGKTGVAIDSVRDMEILFDRIDLSKVTTSMTINSPAMVLLAMYIAVAEKNGIDPKGLGGTIQNDILKEYMARGTYIFPPKPSMHLVSDTFRYCSTHLPRWNPISISGYHIREAGCTAVQEVAFTLADGREYVKTAIEAGLDVDSFAPRLSFFFNAHNNVLEEVAKFRAARRLWARIMKDEFGAKDPRSWMLRFHTQTAGSMLTKEQPMNNAVRVALQALAAVLGGTQSLHTNSMDEALCLPTEAAVRLALRTQQILAHESGVGDIIDPLGGSWAVEKITDRIEESAVNYLSEIDRQGGMLKAIENGYPQREIQNAAYEWQKSVDSGERIIVGLNKFQSEQSEDEKIEYLRVDISIGEKQCDRLKKLRAERDNSETEKALSAVQKAASERGEIFEAVLDAVRVQATLGEICDRMRSEFGIYRENIVV